MYEFDRIRLIVVGSNKRGNSFAKKEAISILQPRFDAVLGEDISGAFGCDRLTQAIVKADILYVVNFKLHVDLTTISRFAIARHNATQIIASRATQHETIQHYIDGVATPSELIEHYL